jgi:hypothetical protein
VPVAAGDSFCRRRGLCVPRPARGVCPPSRRRPSHATSWRGAESVFRKGACEVAEWQAASCGELSPRDDAAARLRAFVFATHFRFHAPRTDLSVPAATRGRRGPAYRLGFAFFDRLRLPSGLCGFGGIESMRFSVASRRSIVSRSL